MKFLILINFKVPAPSSTSAPLPFASQVYLLSVDSQFSPGSYREDSVKPCHKRGGMPCQTGGVRVVKYRRIFSAIPLNRLKLHSKGRIKRKEGYIRSRYLYSRHVFHVKIVMNGIDMISVAFALVRFALEFPLTLIRIEAVPFPSPSTCIYGSDLSYNGPCATRQGCKIKDQAA